jgi:carbon monoxide dehydrogenase subunit G
MSDGTSEAAGSKPVVKRRVQQLDNVTRIDVFVDLPVGLGLGQPRPAVVDPRLDELAEQVLAELRIALRRTSVGV